MSRYSRDNIESILQSAYYDRRTDYVWKYILGGKKDPEINPYPISNLESFVMMDDMLRKRRRTLQEFLKAWKTESRPSLLDCTYNHRSGILRLRTRSFTFTYREKLREFHFAVYPEIAKTIGIVERETRKRYRKDKLFDLYYLDYLDDEIYSRYTDILNVKEWRKSPQFETDCKYCEAMIPFIMQEAEPQKKMLGNTMRLNIILSGKDKVRIGIVKDYSPEEMISMPSYSREEWQEGIRAAFSTLEQRYAEVLAAHAQVMQAWNKELTDIVLGKASYSIEERGNKYRLDPAITIRYTDKVVCDALGIPLRQENSPRKLNLMFMTKGNSHLGDVDLSRTQIELVNFRISFDWKERTACITLKEEIAHALNYEPVSVVSIPHNAKIDNILLISEDFELQSRYRDSLDVQEKQKRPQHQLLVEAVRYIILQTAPLIAYTGPNTMIKDEYKLNMEIDDADTIKVKVSFSSRSAKESFTLDDYKTRFRIWWSQQLLKECKYAKECALNPELDLQFAP